MANKKIGSGKHYVRLGGSKSRGRRLAWFGTRLGRLFLRFEFEYSDCGFRFDGNTTHRPVFRIYVNKELLEPKRNILCVRAYLGWLHFYGYAADMKGL